MSQFAANSLNQLKARPAGGPVRFQGSISAAGSVTINGQPAAVTVNGQPAQVTNEFNGSNPRHIFAAEPLLANGANLVTITATDANNNVRSQQYSVEVSGAGATEPTYDDDGNMLTNGSGQTYTWDAESRLIRIGYADGAATRFQYDALGRRVCIVERDNADAIVTEKRLLWHGYEIIEELDGANAVTRRYHTHGFTIPGPPVTKYYTTTDHLGSVRAILEQDGALDARFDYDPYGVRTAISGSPGGIQYEFGYTGHYYHARSGLHLAPYRAYAADLGRWISRDPIAEDGGINLYGYVGNGPVIAIDPLGLDWLGAVVGGGFGALAGGTLGGGAGSVGGGAVGSTVPGPGTVAGGIAGFVSGEAVGATIGGAVGMFIGEKIPLYEVIKWCTRPHGKGETGNILSSSFPPGYWPGDKGAEEWGRRDGCGAAGGRRKFHDIKQGDSMSGATDDYGVDPNTGDVIDHEGNSVGNLND